MKKSDIPVMPQFFDRYINLVEDMPISDAFVLHETMENLISLDLLNQLDGLRYAPDK